MCGSLVPIGKAEKICALYLLLDFCLIICLFKLYSKPTTYINR